MTNEAIAISIKNGCNELYNELWEQTHWFIVKAAYSFYNHRKSYCDTAGITTDDLIQSGFFALIKAVEAYDPNTGYKLLAYIKYPLLNIWNRMLSPNDMITHSTARLEDNVSPNANDYCPMSDIIPDPAAYEDMEQVIENEMQRELEQAVAAALDTLPDQLRWVLHERYWEQKSLNTIDAQMSTNTTRARTLELKALRELRKDRISKTLRPFAEEMLNILAYHSNGYAAFKTNQASGPELAFERAENRLIH